MDTVMVLFLDIAILNFKMYQQMEEKPQIHLDHIDEQYALRCVEVEYKLVDKWKLANMF